MLRVGLWTFIVPMTQSVSRGVPTQSVGTINDCLLAVLEAVKTTKAKHGMAFED